MTTRRGKILVVDLATGESSVEVPEDSVYDDYLGGSGLGAWYLGRNLPPMTDPLGPDNILGFCPGLLSGTKALFSGRWSVVGLSPLTGGYGDSNCGGSLSPEIKRAGYDAIFFRGASEKPVYLLIDTQGPRLMDASGLWLVKDAVETEEILSSRHARAGRKARCATIGQAGERLSRIAGIANDAGRMAARSGLGAVMGSKRLKALVINVPGLPPQGEARAIGKVSRKVAAWVRQPRLPQGLGAALRYFGLILRLLPFTFRMNGVIYKFILKKWGTSSMDEASILWRDAPIKNWKGSHRDFPARFSRSIGADRISEREVEKYHCVACPLGCGGKCSMSHGPWKETHKPEYESILALGGLSLSRDRERVFSMNELLNRAGMDSISAGSTAAFAFECYEKGVISKTDTGGLELTWGNAVALEGLIRLMIAREGIGDVLADGVKEAARRLGRGSAAWAVHAGGSEPAMHDGRTDTGFALHYSVEPTPGRHTIGANLYYDMFELWKAVSWAPPTSLLYPRRRQFRALSSEALKSVAMSAFMNLVNAGGFCLFGVFLGARRLPVFSYLALGQGGAVTPDGLMEVGKRIQALKQRINVDQGIDPRSAALADRGLGLDFEIRDNEGRAVPLAKMRRDYWKAMGFDPESGRPLPETLKTYGIKEGGRWPIP